jgi:hypothetical protein
MLFCVKHILIICIHFVLLIKSGSVVSERFAPSRLNACSQRGQGTKNWVSSLFLLRKKSLACPSDLSWKEKIKMMGQEILSKIFLEEALTQQRNEMMDIFAQILQRLPTGDTSSSSGGVTPFKVQINFNIPIFEGQIDTDVVDKWLNLLEGYFSVHNFSNRENITFALLKVVPHVKYWWETFFEQKEVEEPSLSIVTTTWESFKDVIKEQYYLVESYDDFYTKWTTLWQERDQGVSEFTNIFHTLPIKLGIKYSERYLVLKYHGALHRYIHTKMEFLDISSLGATYRYAVKIEQKLKQKT